MRRLLSIIVLCLCGLCHVQAQDGRFPGGLDDDGRDPAEINDEEIYRVTNEPEFLAALGNDRTVVIAAGVRLNLSRVLEDETRFMNQPGRRWVSDATAIVSKQPLVVSESETDGRQLVLLNMKNLIIKGDQDACIEVDPRYSYCLSFINCDGCVVENLTIGHTEGGYCTGGVIGVRGGRMMMVKDCDLYGCGTYGLDLTGTTDFSMLNSNVHDCTYGIMQLRSCVAVRFNRCDFFSNREYDLIEGVGCEGLSFDDCRFFANWGDAPLFNLDNTFYLMGCQIYHPTQNLGTINRAEMLGKKTIIIDNPIDPSIQGRGIGPKISAPSQGDRLAPSAQTETSSPLEVIKNGWKSKTIDNVINGSLGIMLECFDQTWPTWMGAGIRATMEKGLSKEVLDNETGLTVTVDTRNGYVEIGDAGTDRAYMSACVWNRKNGHRLFAVHMGQPTDPFVEFVCFYDYDQQQKTLTPEPGILAGFKEWTRQAPCYFKLPKVGKGLVVDEYGSEGHLRHIFSWDGMKPVYAHTENIGDDGHIISITRENE